MLPPVQVRPGHLARCDFLRPGPESRSNHPEPLFLASTVRGSGQTPDRAVVPYWTVSILELLYKLTARIESYCGWCRAHIIKSGTGGTDTRGAVLLSYQQL